MWVALKKSIEKKSLKENNIFSRIDDKIDVYNI